MIAVTPESVQFYQEFPLAVGQTVPRSAAYRRRQESRQQKLARYLARRIDRETYLEDIQLSIWSNESMKSSAFEDFHLSDLECGVKSHHDHIRAILPVANLRNRPGEDQVAAFRPFVFEDGMKLGDEVLQLDDGLPFGVGFHV